MHSSVGLRTGRWFNPWLIPHSPLLYCFDDRRVESRRMVGGVVLSSGGKDPTKAINEIMLKEELNSMQ